MESDTVERVTKWDSSPFSDGHAGLHEFAEQEFTGAVTDGRAWLFMLNGRVLGVFGGDMAQFADADGTAYSAPDQSLPLLFTMQETGGEVRGEYYTEKTPISEVDQTLQSGNFTGYVELSENVLSGDYYLAYYGGRQLPVAFVGNQSRRLTGDDAFERAADEVGIYRVKTVGLEIVDVPETDDSTVAAGRDEPEDTDSTAPAATGGAAAGSDTEDTSAETADDADEQPGMSPFDDDSSGSPGWEPAGDSEQESTEGGATAEREPAAVESTGTADRTAAERATEAVEVESTDTGGQSATEREPTDDAQGANQFDAESTWRETTTIPALDPSDSVTIEAASAARAAEPAEPTPEPEQDSPQVPSEQFAELQDERDRLQQRVADLEEETEQLAGENERLERERDEAASQVEGLEAEITELQATVENLEGELEATEAKLSAAQEYVPDGDHELAPDEAMSGTSLFVRYERKGGATLTDAHNGDASREEVNDNIRLEHHTEFEDDGAVVEGEPFEIWLRGTMEHSFVQWLTRTFVHDVQETRNQTAVKKLFDAVPDIDRIEFRGSIELDTEEEAGAESATFDVVLRDRMGKPLVVTDLNESREPATEQMLEALVRNGTPVAEQSESLAGAFFVTTSYYEPGALETAEEATGGGFLSRDKQKSFVKLSRKDGYHLCLVETRDGEFHVSVPEL